MVVIRQAGDGDHEIISEIGKHYDSEFIRFVYKTWQNQGSLYFAEQEGTLVGFCGLAFPSPTESQILGIRMLPKYQREDVGRQFVIALMQVAQERGCNIVRMLTSTSNFETQAALQRNLNFERRGTWVVGYREKLQKKFCSGTKIEPAPPEMLDDIWQFLQYSLTYRHSEGLIFNIGYSFRSFSKAYLSQLLGLGQVYVSRDGDTLAGIAVAHSEEDTLILRYVDARPPVVLDLLQGIICGQECDCQYLISAIPADAYREVKPFLEHAVESHTPDNWLVMEKEVSPLALPRD